LFTHRDETARIDQARIETEKRALQYFLDNANPETGLVRDWALNFSPTPEGDRVASIAATGFGLAVIANASTRGLLKPEFARDYALKALTFCRDHVPRRRGWFLHFIDWRTGARLLDSEYSTVDTAWLIAGALYAARVLEDPAVRAVAHRLYADLDFQDMLTDGGRHPRKQTLSMAYKDGEGYTAAQWDMYAEQKLLLILGLGHPVHPLKRANWAAFDRRVSVLPDGRKVMGLDGALFLHQYSELFIDFRAFEDGFLNYHDNSVTVTHWHRGLMTREARQFKTLGAGFWGFSAGRSPNGYAVWSALHFSGTVCIGCTVASVMFWPEVVLSDMYKWMNGPYRDRIWGRYGFVDSLNIDQNWFAQRVLGITVGPAYLALANLRETTSIWREFMDIPEIRLGLNRARGPAAPLAEASNTESR
jgi:hypothetical protein